MSPLQPRGLPPADYDAYHSEGRTELFGDVFERVRMHTVRAVARHLDPLPGSSTFLDLGAGEGRYLPIWHDIFPVARIVALEYSALASQRSGLRHPFADHLVATAEAIPLAAESIDALASIEVLEHVSDSHRMLAECYRVLKPGGWALISTPCGNAGSLEWLMNALNEGIVSGRNGGILFSRTDDPTHLRRYRSLELRQLCDRIGFVVEQQLFDGHVFLTLASRLESLVHRHFNIRRRSALAADVFLALIDEIGMIDGRLLRRLPFASSMVLLLRKPDTSKPRAS